MKRKKRQWLKGKLATAIARCFGQLPLSVNRQLGKLIGEITWLHRGRSATTCQENLQRCFPELPSLAVNKMARRSLIETGSLALEVMSVWGQPYRRLQKYVRNIEGFEFLERGLARGKGVMFIAPHLGNWEMYGAYLGQHYQVSFMFAPTGIADVDALMERGRCQHGGQTTPANRKGVTKVLQDLRANRVVCILPDQIADENNSKVVPFFGQPARTMTLVHRLIQRTDCTVVIGFCKRVPGGFDLIVREANAAIGTENVVASLTAMNQSIEQLVREAPEQYQWEYRRFKKVE